VPLDFDGYGFGPTTPEYPTAVTTMQRLRYCRQNHDRLGGAHAKLNREACLKDGWTVLSPVMVSTPLMKPSRGLLSSSSHPPAAGSVPFPDRSLIDLSSYHFA